MKSKRCNIVDTLIMNYGIETDVARHTIVLVNRAMKIVLPGMNAPYQAN